MEEELRYEIDQFERTMITMQRDLNIKKKELEDYLSKIRQVTPDKHIKCDYCKNM